MERTKVFFKIKWNCKYEAGSSVCDFENASQALIYTIKELSRLYGDGEHPISSSIVVELEGKDEYDQRRLAAALRKKSLQELSSKRT